MPGLDFLVEQREYTNESLARKSIAGKFIDVEVRENVVWLEFIKIFGLFNYTNRDAFKYVVDDWRVVSCGEIGRPTAERRVHASGTSRAQRRYKFIQGY